MGFLEGLTILLVALKAFGVITWSWWLVIAPMYPAILIYILVFFFIGTTSFSMLRMRRKK